MPEELSLQNPKLMLDIPRATLPEASGANGYVGDSGAMDTPVGCVRLDRLHTETINLSGEHAENNTFKTDVYTEKPIASKAEGFMIGELPADLLMVIQPGTAGINTLGIVKARPASKAEEPNEQILLVRLQTVDGVTSVANNDGGSPAAVELLSDTEYSIGRKYSSEALLGLGLENDEFMSGKHLKIKQDSHGVISVEDLNSTNGTAITLGAELVPFTHEDLSVDMELLRRERALGRTTINSEGVVESVPERKIIDSVPQSAEEASAALEVERSKRMQPLFEQVRSLEDSIEQIRGKYGPDQQLLMTRYANEWILKGESQVSEDGEGSYYHEGKATEAYFALPESARSDAGLVMTLMHRVDALNRRIFS